MFWIAPPPVLQHSGATPASAGVAQGLVRLSVLGQTQPWRQEISLIHETLYANEAILLGWFLSVVEKQVEMGAGFCKKGVSVRSSK